MKITRHFPLYNVGVSYCRTNHTEGNHHESRTVKTVDIFDENLIEQLRLHTEWVESVGKAGKQFVVVNAQLKAVNLSGRLLCEAVLPEAILDEANLSQTDFYAANLASASLVGANLERAILVKTNLDYAKLIVSDLCDAKLIRASLLESDLHGSNLTRTDLSGAYLKATNLEGAYLRNANLTNVGLYATRFVNANLAEITGFDTAHGDNIIVSVDGHETIISGEENIRAWLKDASQTK